MEEEEIFKKIESIYKDEKGKKFISHLIRSFTPISKATYLFETPKDKSKLVCCITGAPLMSKDEAVVKAINNAETSFKLFTNAILTEGKEQQEAIKAKEENMKSTYKGKVLAIFSEESDKYFCKEAFDVFHNWLTNKILSGDSHINWLLKSHKKNETLKFAKQNNIPVTQKEEKVFNKAVNNPKKVTLGDNDILKQLAEKFKKETQ